MQNKRAFKDIADYCFDLDLESGIDSQENKLQRQNSFRVIFCDGEREPRGSKGLGSRHRSKSGFEKVEAHKQNMANPVVVHEPPRDPLDCISRSLAGTWACSQVCWRDRVFATRVDSRAAAALRKDGHAVVLENTRRQNTLLEGAKAHEK